MPELWGGKPPVFPRVPQSASSQESPVSRHDRLAPSQTKGVLLTGAEWLYLGIKAKYNNSVVQWNVGVNWVRQGVDSFSYLSLWETDSCSPRREELQRRVFIIYAEPCLCSASTHRKVMYFVSYPYSRLNEPGFAELEALLVTLVCLHFCSSPCCDTSWHTQLFSVSGRDRSDFGVCLSVLCVS